MTHAKVVRHGPNNLAQILIWIGYLLRMIVSTKATQNHKQWHTICNGRREYPTNSAHATSAMPDKAQKIHNVKLASMKLNICIRLFSN